MKRHVLVLSLLACAQAAMPTVFQNTTDSQLVDQSQAIVVATVHDSLSRATEHGIVTDYHLVVEQALKGNVPEVITVTEFGGAIGTRFELIPDSAVYTPGERVRAYLKRRADGTYFTASMAHGKVTIDGVRETALQHRIAPNGSAKSYALSFSGLPLRWPTSTPPAFKVAGAMPGYTANVGAGASAWTNDPNSNINLSVSGTSAQTDPEPNGTIDSPVENTVFLAYDKAISGGLCDGTAACTIIRGDTTVTHPFDGDTWISIQDADIVVRSSVPATQFNALITHEFGHAIGIRHSDAASPSSFAAIMASTVPAVYGSNLQQWDKDAVDSLYGAGPVCTAPSTVTVTGGGTVASGSTVTLTATPNGTATVSYQWYDGLTGDTSTPVGTNSKQFTTPPITTTKNYWVRVTSTSATCPGSVDSATVTLTPQTCQKPAITLDPASATITSGQSTTLSVGATGSQPLTFTWYQGAPPDTSNPIVGANASQFTTPALTQTTSYWVRVSNSCGSADSKAAVITVPGTCSGPTFSIQPASITVAPGKLSYLTALAPDATSYQWYQGTAPDTSQPLSGLSSSAEAFVEKMFIDVLRRTPTASELATWNPSNFGGSRFQAANSLVATDEYRTMAVNDLYMKYLRRAATPHELSLHLNPFLHPYQPYVTLRWVTEDIFTSDEYYALAGNTDAGFLNRFYNDLLGRSPTAEEISSGLSTMSEYQGKGRVVDGVGFAVASTTGSEAIRFAVQNIFTSVLRRSADASELATGVGLWQARGQEGVIAYLVGLPEYVNFGTMLPVNPQSSTSFWVKASSGTCSANSTTANVTVSACSPITILTQPQNATVTIGRSATFAVLASGSTTYQWYQGPAGNTSSPMSGATGSVFTTPLLFSAGTTQYWVRVSNGCGGTVDSAAASATVSCGPPAAPVISAPASQLNTVSYLVSWTGNPKASQKYDVQEAKKSDFSDATTFTITDGSNAKTYSHPEVASDTRFFYRVRGYAVCDGSVGSFSTPTSVLVIVPPPQKSDSLNLVAAPCSSCTLSQSLFIGGSSNAKTAPDATDTFVVTSDKPFVTITPSSGPLPPEGTTVTVTINTSGLPAGSTESSLTVTKTQSSAKTGVLGTTTTTVPVSVSLVTPVTPAPKNGNPPPNTVLVPAIAHADGVNSQFQSDVRITNTAPQPITYQLTYTPSATDGSTSKQTQISIDAGETKALDDVVKNWYGAGAQGEGGIGTLEIRPLNYAGKTGVDVSFATVAASRTYNNTANGTFGQYIPAIPLIDFLAKSDINKISLQQVAQSKAYRTNLGFVEGSGQAVDFVATLLDDKNNVVTQRSYSLKPFEHQQIPMSSFFPGFSVSDGRLEVKVTSDLGRLTAYASVLDNTTSDPLLVFPVDPSTIGATRFVVPGVAELNNGSANFHTDLRVFNGGATATNVTLAFGSAQTQKQLAAGEVWSVDNVLPTLFGVNGAGGAVVATTSTPAPLVLTARTYSRRDDGGTFGQFIPGVTSSDAVGVGDRALQVVQLEQSPAFRSNLGLVEVTGNPVTVDVAGFAPDSKVAAHVQVTLAPGQFTQLNSVLAGMGFGGNVYNGRIAVTVTSGTGRVAAYGSVVDNRTQDPTYVPAQ